jgi:hypothetical protein
MAIVLRLRALNRALLERQLMLRPAKLAAIGAIEHLVGMQAQTPNAPYLGLWARLAGFQHDDLITLMENRSVVRIALMRGTIHLVTADDCLGLRPLVQPVIERGMKGTFGRRLKGLKPQLVAAAGCKLVERQPCTFSEIGVQLRKKWPKHEGAALANAVRALLPLVQIPPRGIWGSSGQARYVTAETWLGKSMTSGIAVGEMVMRYLRAFGPATVKDMQAWSGLTRLSEIVARLRPRLCTFENEEGQELFDLPDAPRPDPDTPGPPRFLPVFDNVLLGHADRRRILREEHRHALFGSGGLLLGTVLVDGFVGGTWKIKEHGDSATLTVETFGSLRMQERNLLEEEGTRLLSFAVAYVHRKNVEFARWK